MFDSFAVMYEVEAANFLKGVFQLRLNKIRRLGPLAPIFRLGPVKGRLIAFGGLVFALLLTINHAPSRFFMENNWAADPVEALALQHQIAWGIAIAFGALYLLVFLFRQESMELDFDRKSQTLYLYHTPFFFLMPRRQRSWAFSDIRKIEVLAPDSSPKSPHGMIRLQGPATMPTNFRQLEFRLLSAEQFKFFPLNINRLTEIDPVGDWQDPDDEPVIP